MNLTGVRKHKSDRIIGFLTIFLLVVGLVVIFAIGPMRANFMSAAYGYEVDENSFFVHQLISVVVSLVAFFGAFFFPYEKMRKFSLITVGLGLFLCFMLLIFQVADLPLAGCENGACRWIRLGSSFSIQPSEFLKLGLVLYLAQLAAKRKEEKALEKTDFFVPFSVISALSIVFVVYFQQDLGSTVVIVAILLAILLMSGVKMKIFAMVLGVMLVGGVVAIFSSPHRIERVMTFSSAENSDSYHIDNALLAIGTGGFSGVGVGNTVQATGYLPESINDSVFAVMGEAFGFLGLMLVLLAFSVLLFRILRIYELRPNDEYGLLAVGVFAWIASQVIINICAMTGLFPLTGITLPLLSYGGTSMIFTTFALGLMGQISCYTRRKVDVKEEKRVKISQRGIKR